MIIVSFVLEVWRADFNVPFCYEWRDLRQGGDALDPLGSNDVLLFCSLFKGMRENGWYLHNPGLGAPGALDFHDYPIGECVNFLSAKVIGWFTPGYGMTMNLLYLLSFPLTALSALFVFRQFKISDLLAVVGSLLYTFAPYHFLRGQQHLWLATYYAVPLLVLVLFWILEGEPLFPMSPGKKGFPIGITRKGVAAVAIAALLACTGIYYSLFGVFLLFVVCLMRCRSWKSLVTPGVVTGVIVLTVFLNTLPTLIYIAEHGKNTEVPNRYPAQVEYFALRIMQMIVPVMHHRISSFAKFSSDYFQSAPFVTENATACLGLVASAGFVILVVWLLGLRWQTSREPAITALSAMTICSVLLATMGGFGSLLAFGVSPVIRCYNRFSIIIAFFAILTVLFLFEKLRERFVKSAESRVMWTGGVILLLCLGLADQTTGFFVPPYAQSAASFRNDKSFVERIEARVPPEAMIFQLPYFEFPEGTPGSMELLRPYLHSRSLRWSFGAMKGRETDNWIKTAVLGDGNLQRIVQVLADKGFKGIYIDRRLFTEHAKLEEALKKMVDASPIESENGRMVFYGFGGSSAPASR